MGLEPIGQSEVDLIVDGERVDQFTITDNGNISVNTDAQVDSGGGLGSLLTGSKSGSYSPYSGATRTHSLFDFASAVDVAFDWYLSVYEGDDPYKSGRYTRLVADGNVIDGVTNDYGKRVKSSGQRVVTCSSARVEWEAFDNDTEGGSSNSFDVSWDATPEVSKSVSVGVQSSAYNK